MAGCFFVLDSRSDAVLALRVYWRGHTIARVFGERQFVDAVVRYLAPFVGLGPAPIRDLLLGFVDGRASVLSDDNLANHRFLSEQQPSRADPELVGDADHVSGLWSASTGLEATDHGPAAGGEDSELVDSDSSPASG